MPEIIKEHERERSGCGYRRVALGIFEVTGTVWPLTVVVYEPAHVKLRKLNTHNEKAGLTLNIKKTKIKASGPITSWQIDWEKVETVRDFILGGGSKVTADGDNSQEIKRCMLFGRKAVTNLGSILKSRDITLLTKVHLVKAMVFPVVMYGCESWAIKKAEC